MNVTSAESSIYLADLPRAYFWAHSYEVLKHLNHQAEFAASPSILHFDCGIRSSLAPLIQQLWPGNSLQQIDSRRRVVEASRSRCVEPAVEHMSVEDMQAVEDGSKDIVIADSCLDRYSYRSLPVVSREIHRVLKPNGFVFYLHSQPINPVSVAASLNQEHSEPVYLVPNDRWHPSNDMEYAVAPKVQIDQELADLGSEAHVLTRYLDELHPSSDTVKNQNAYVEFLRRC